VKNKQGTHTTAPPQPHAQPLIQAICTVQEQRQTSSKQPVCAWPIRVAGAMPTVPQPRAPCAAHRACCPLAALDPAAAPAQGRKAVRQSDSQAGGQRRGWQVVSALLLSVVRCTASCEFLCIYDGRLKNDRCDSQAPAARLETMATCCIHRLPCRVDRTVQGKQALEGTHTCSNAPLLPALYLYLCTRSFSALLGH
jgi:hypothetical protein